MLSIVAFILITISGQCYSFNNIITYLGKSRTRASSYAKYTSWNSIDKGIITMSFITSDPDGLLLHIGDSNTTEWTRNYLELRIRNGMLNFISKVKNGSNVVKWKRVWYAKEVDDLTWHKVEIRRDGINAMIELDEEKMLVQFGVLGIKTIALKGVIYTGGAPNGGSLDCGKSSRAAE